MNLNLFGKLNCRTADSSNCERNGQITDRARGRKKAVANINVFGGFLNFRQSRSMFFNLEKILIIVQISAMRFLRGIIPLVKIAHYPLFSFGGGKYRLFYIAVFNRIACSFAPLMINDFSLQKSSASTILEVKVFKILRMKLAKFLAAVAVVVFAVVLAYMLIGLIINVVWYLFVFAVIGAAGYGAYKLFAAKNNSKQLDSKNDSMIDDNEFDRADRLLDEYKKKLSLKQ
jgi:hypothetical protein